MCTPIGDDAYGVRDAGMRGGLFSRFEIRWGECATDSIVTWVQLQTPRLVHGTVQCFKARNENRLGFNYAIEPEHPKEPGFGF